MVGNQCFQSNKGPRKISQLNRIDMFQICSNSVIIVLFHLDIDSATRSKNGGSRRSPHLFRIDVVRLRFKTIVPQNCSESK